MRRRIFITAAVVIANLAATLPASAEIIIHR